MMEKILLFLKTLKCIYMTAVSDVNDHNNARFSINLTDHPKISCAQGKKILQSPFQRFKGGERAFLWETEVLLFSFEYVFESSYQGP